MNKLEAKRKVLKYHWEPWLKRPFFGFAMSTFQGGNTKNAFKKIGLNGWEYQSFLFSKGEWYQAEEVYEKTKPVVMQWLKHHSVKEISYRLEKSHLIWKQEILKLALMSDTDTCEKLERLYKIFREITTYVWAVHILEHFFTPMLHREVGKVIPKNINKFIGDASFPEKSNALEQMVEEYKKGIRTSVLAKKYGWMRARDGFSEPYTNREITSIARHALSQSKYQRPVIPKKLQHVFGEARELVYLRMLRMDVYFELMFCARPILKTVAKKFKIPFSQLKFYTINSLVAGEPKFYPADFSCFSLRDKIFFFGKPILDVWHTRGVDVLKGTIAQVGAATGRVKVVMSVGELHKVKQGDILVTYMTSPNFLPAMKLAKAYVTDEGGLTCHAAIVAREMKKPCIIGTKIATKVFKDGDMVEVDAYQGIIKKIEK